MLRFWTPVQLYALAQRHPSSCVKDSIRSSGAKSFLIISRVSRYHVSRVLLPYDFEGNALYRLAEKIQALVQGLDYETVQVSVC